MGRRLRLLAWMGILAGTLAAWALLLRIGFQTDQKTVLWQLWLCSALVMVFLSAIAWLLHTTPPWAIKLPPWLTVAIILTIAVGLRIAMMVWWVPTLSDDFFRYRRDGHVVLHGMNPYRYLPTDMAVPHPANWNLSYAQVASYPYDLMDRMSNNAQVPTIYGPVSEMLFGAAAWMENHFVASGRFHPRAVPPPRNTRRWYAMFYQLGGNPRFWPYRGMHVLADVGVVIWLLLILAQMKRSLWWAALYAWNPLPLIEIAGNGHLESPGVFFFIGAFWAGNKKHWGLAAACLALALMVKIYAIIAVPVFVLWFFQETPVKNWRAGLQRLTRPAVIYILVTVVCLLPFITGLPDLYRTMRIYAQNWEFNGLLFHLLRWLAFAGNAGPIRPILAVLWWGGMVVILAAAWRGRWPAPKVMGHTLMLYLMLMPQVYPWYVLWPLALLPLAWNCSTWIFSWTVLLSYQVWMIYHATGQWRMSEWVFLVEWMPVVTLAFYQWGADGGWRLLRRRVVRHSIFTGATGAALTSRAGGDDTGQQTP